MIKYKLFQKNRVKGGTKRQLNSKKYVQDILFKKTIKILSV